MNVKLVNHAQQPNSPHLLPYNKKTNLPDFREALSKTGNLGIKLNEKETIPAPNGKVLIQTFSFGTITLLLLSVYLLRVHNRFPSPPIAELV